MTRPLYLRLLRPIPAVMALTATLLVIKGTGLVMDARAQEQSAASMSLAASPAAEDPAPKDDPASDDTDNSSAQVDILHSLAKRRAELDARERDLDMRENLIAAAEKRVDAKIASLKELQSQIQVLLVQRDDGDQKELAALVKTYSAMAPKDAARIFDNLNDDVLLAVAAAMKPADLAPVLAKMQSEAAQKLTTRLANRLKLPAADQVAQQMAQAALPAPVPGAPAAQSAASPALPAAAPGSSAPTASPQQAAAPDGKTAPPTK